jgi:hypothetical protein
VTAKGTRIQVTARRVGTLFRSRNGTDYGPLIWEYDVRIGRRVKRVTVTMPSREVRADVRRLVNRLARGR